MSGLDPAQEEETGPDRIVKERAQMGALRRNLSALRGATEALNQRLVQDLDDIEKAKREAEYAISTVDKVLLRMKRVSTGSFTFTLFMCTLGIGCLLFISFLMA